MQWEYMQVTVSEVDRKLLVLSIDGEPAAPVGQKPRWYDFRNKAGKEGWEMVNFRGDFYSDTEVMFKRPIEE